MINFFKSEYIKKYPEMSGYQYFNYMNILEIDKDLQKFLIDKSKSERQSHENKRKEMEEKFLRITEEIAEFTHDDIYDYFIDLIDYMEDTILNTKPSIDIGTIVDDMFVNCSKSNKRARIFENGLFFYQKANRVPNIKPNRIYYSLDFSTYSFGDEDEDISAGTLDYQQIEKFIEKEYGLSKDMKKNTNESFRLIDIGDCSKYNTSFIGRVGFSIFLEQI